MSPPRSSSLHLLLRYSAAMALPARHAPRGRSYAAFQAERPDSEELVYFTLGGCGPGGQALPPACFPPRPGRAFSFGVPVGRSPTERVRLARLHREARQRLGRELGLLAGADADGGGCWPLLAYEDGGGGGGLERGFLVPDRRRRPETRRALEALLRRLLPPPLRLLAVYEAAEDGQVWRWLWRLREEEEEEEEGQRELLGKERVVVPVEQPRRHPLASRSLLDSAVFRSFADARGILQECTSLIPEAKAVLDLVDQCPMHVKKGDFPVIVIEGLDATGKTTVTHALKDSLNAVLLSSPPPCVIQWRKVFDDEPMLIRRAFYALTNYIVASEIAEQSIKAPVIVDRFWHSTAAYTIAAEISGNIQHLFPVHHHVYCWPEDLLRPDLVLLLTVSPQERIRRLQGRGIEKTKEEAELETNSLLRQKVEESYRRMENPTCQLVDASPSREEVLKTVLHLIKKQFPFL